MGSLSIVGRGLSMISGQDGQMSSLPGRTHSNRLDFVEGQRDGVLTHPQDQKQRRYLRVSKIEDRIESVATKMVSKLVPKRLVDKPIPEQVKIARNLAHFPMSGGFPTVRRNLLKDTGLPADFRDKLKEGMSRDEIKDHYWQHPEFQEFWTKDLKMTEGMFDQLIDDTIAALNHGILEKASKPSQ